jgi:hypothetical protein
MSIELEHTLSLARTLVVSGDLARAAAQLDRASTLDVHRRMARQLTMLRVVLDVRLQRLPAAQQGVDALTPLVAEEMQLLADMLASTPEAAHPEYRRWVRKLMKRTDGASSQRVAPWWRSPAVMAGAAVAACAALVLVAVVLLRPRPQTPEAALGDLLVRLEQGDFLGIWSSFPEVLRQDADLAFRAVTARVPDRALEDYRVIDRGLSSLVFERTSLLAGSKVAAIGPLFRTLAGEEDARALASYLKLLSESPLYDRAWLSRASVADAIGAVTGGDFADCWKTYFRSWALEDPLFSRMVGISGTTIGRILRSPRTLAIAVPDDGSGKVVLAILMPEGQRVDVAMRLVDGTWMPAALADGWRMSTLRAQSEIPLMQEALAHVYRVRPSLRPEGLDARKLMIIEAKRARTQEEFDVAAAKFFASP